MRLLIIDPQGAALDIAMRAIRDNHEVKWFIRQTEKTKYIGRGLVNIVDDYSKWLRWANLVLLADNTMYLRDMDAARKDGVLVMGPTQETAAWELDREAGMKVFKKHGIPTPPYKSFTDYDSAIAHVKRTGERCVSKPSGSDDKSLSYCASSAADMVFMLQRWKRMNKLKGAFIVQEFIAGTEMAVGGWFGPGGWNVGWCENFEFKKLMNHDMGVATGEQGTVLRYVRQSKLAQKVLAPLTDTLEKMGYCGYVDVNCIVDDKGVPWPLEFTMRPGWPTFNIQQAVHQGDSAQWMLDLAQGKDARQATMDLIAIGVVVSIPDYPYSHLTRKEVVDIPVYGIKRVMLDHAHPCEMKLGQAPHQIDDKIIDLPCMVSAGDYILVMSATGATVQEARQSVYRRLERLKMPNSPMWRTDIGSRLATQLPEVQKMGYAKAMKYSTDTPASGG